MDMQRQKRHEALVEAALYRWLDRHSAATRIVIHGAALDAMDKWLALHSDVLLDHLMATLTAAIMDLEAGLNGDEAEKTSHSGCI